MPSTHEWDRIHEKKLDWAYSARENLVKDCKNHDIFYFEDHDESSEMMISVYGKSQRGKTTCILSLLGVQEDKILTVSDILRGNRKRGTSATATATAYKRSSSDTFGLAYGDVIELVLEDEVFRHKMDEVRAQIENHPGSIDLITIFIPKKFFIEEDQSFKYRIVDLPGVESAEEKEREHVEALVEKYFKSSDSVLVVELANALTDLGNISFAKQGLDTWSRRFKVILTRSFSLESVKNMILGKEEEEIYETLREYYKEEVRRSLGKKLDQEIEIYPLEFGESLLEFISQYPDQESSVNSVLVRLKEELLQSISESLTIEDKLIESVYMTNTIKSRVEEKKEERDRILETLDRKIIRAERSLDEEGDLGWGLKDGKDAIMKLNTVLEMLESLDYSNLGRDIETYLRDFMVFSEDRNFPIPFRSSVAIGVVPQKSVKKEVLLEDLIRIRRNMRDGIYEEVYEEIFQPILSLRDRDSEEVITAFEKVHLKTEFVEFKEVQDVVERIFIWKKFKKCLSEEFSDILINSLQEYYNTYINQLLYHVSELVEKCIVFIRKKISMKKDKIRSIEVRIRNRERSLQEMRLTKILKIKYYDEIISHYEADALIVSKFQVYLDSAFKKEYNEVMHQMDDQKRAIWDLLYLKLITDKHQYFTNKLENKYGKTIS